MNPHDLETSYPEMDLDPRTEDEWAEVQQAGYRLVDLVLKRHRGLREAPAWRPMPGSLLQQLRQSAPRRGMGLAFTLAKAEEALQPYDTGNLSPRFWGWVMGGGNLPGILGDWLASGMNANVFAGDQGPVHLEQQVLEWFREWFGFPTGASGLLVDGASTATLIGIHIARHRATDGRSKTDGPEASRGLRIYCSQATHNSVLKSAQLLGLGSNAVHWTATDGDGRINLQALEDAIAEDRRAGLRPFCLVGSAGTVGVGAIDPLESMREIASRHALWFHVDGAIGALAILSEKLRPRFAGIELADSLAFDLHKWGQVPYDAGCILVRDERTHREAFQTGTEYLASVSGGISAHGAHGFNAYGPQLSRRDRALKIWTTFTALGTDRLAAAIEMNVRQAQYLAQRIAAEPALELLSPVALNIVCFRYRGDVTDPEQLNAINERILVELQESGFCVISPFRIEGRFCLRVALSNHRSREADLKELTEQVVAAGRRIER